MSNPPSAQHPWLNPIAAALTGAAISIFFQKDYGSCGDYPQHFAACGWGAGIGAALGLGINLLHRKIPHAGRLQPLLIGFLRYFLAGIMLTYAVVKIIPVQFPHLLANMDSRFSELNPMRVAWTFFGYSKGYQMLMGWAEAIPALLLLFRRTYLLGALLMIPVLVNVVAVNIFFEVCVTLNSSIYLCIALFLVLNQYDRLWTFFFTQKTAPPQAATPPFQNLKTRRLVNILNGVLVAGILAYTAYMAWQAWGRYQLQKSRIAVHGAWQMKKMERLEGDTWLVVADTDSSYIDRLYLQGEQGVLKGPGRRDRILLALDAAAQTIDVTFMTTRNERPLTRRWQYRLPDSNRLSITGSLWADSVRMELVLSDTNQDRNDQIGSVLSPEKIIPGSPEDLAQRQLNGYNAGDLEAFLEPYAEDVEVYDFPNELRSKGKSNMRKSYGQTFERIPDLHCELLNRIVNGNTIIDQERITGFPDGRVVEAMAIYKIENNKIAKVYFLK